jgi:hypothetical protein
MTRGVSEPTPLVIVTIPFHSIRAQCSPVWRMTVKVIRDLHSRYTRCGDCTSLEFPIAQNSANRIKSSLTEIQAQQPPDIAKFERNHKWKRSHSDNIAGLLREQVILPRTALVHIKMCDPKIAQIIGDKNCHRDCNYNPHTNRCVDHFPIDKILPQKPPRSCPHRSIQNPNATCHLAAALQALELNKIRSSGSIELPIGADRLSQFTAKIALISKDNHKIAASKPHQFR